jgi:hypothetical protein
MHNYLYFKSRILVPDFGPSVPKHVAFIDDIIKRLLCFAVIYIFIYMPISIVDELCNGFHIRYTVSSQRNLDFGLYLQVHFPHMLI